MTRWRQKFFYTDWDSLSDPDINIYTRNFTGHLNSLTAECIPNKTMIIRPTDPPWNTTAVRKLIRKRKRAYKRAKQLNTMILWNKFRKIRNKVIESICQSKQHHLDQLSNKLKSESSSSKDWWSTLKTDPDSSVGRVPFRRTGGHGFDPRPRHTKVVKNGTSCSSLGTQIYGVELGLVDPVSG